MADNTFADALRSQGFMVAPGADPRPPQVLLNFGGGIGDDLLCTTPLRELRQRGRPETWMMTAYPDLFTHNPDVDAVVAPSPRLLQAVQAVGCRVIVPWYAPRDWAADQNRIPESHILACICQAAEITGPIALRPYLRLQPSELEFGRYHPRQIAIHSTGLGARYAMTNKEWRPERFQEVVNALKDEYHFVQLGSASDPPLQNAIDLRGKTSLRQTAAVLAHSIVFVGLVGMLMHLARAVECRSVIVYGGRELPWQTGCSCNENISNPLHCSPCWRWNTCGEDHACLMQIQSPSVIDGVRRQSQQAGQRLAEDKFVI